MSVDVIIPWRAQPQRLLPFIRVYHFWETHGYNIILADSPKNQPFNLAKARNTGVKQSKADIVIVSDADTIPDLGNVVKAVAEYKDGVVWPFTYYRHLAPEAVSSSDLHTAPVDKEYRGSVGGTFITSREHYWELGGQDARFEPRWGYDDSAFAAVVRTLSVLHRMPGYVYSFNHAADRDMSNDNPNKHRYDLYKFADGHPERMRELLK